MLNLERVRVGVHREGRGSHTCLADWGVEGVCSDYWLWAAPLTRGLPSVFLERAEKPWCNSVTPRFLGL